MNKQILGIDHHLSKQEKDKIESFSILGQENNFKELVSSILEPQEIEKSIEEMEKVSDFLDNELIKYILIDQKNNSNNLGDIQEEIILNGNLSEKFINDLFLSLINELKNINKNTGSFVNVKNYGVTSVFSIKQKTISYISNIAKTGKLSKDSIDIFNEIFQDFNKYCEKNIINEGISLMIIKSGIVNEENTNNLFLSSFKDWNMFYEEIKAIIETKKVSNENIDFAFENATKKKINDEKIIINLLSPLVLSGQISDDLLNSNFEKIIKYSISDDNRTKYVLINVIKSKQITSDKLNIFFDKVESIFYPPDLLTILIQTGEITEDRLNYFFDATYKISRVNDNWTINVLPALIGTGKIKKEKIDDYFIKILANSTNGLRMTSVLPEVVKLGLKDKEAINMYNDFIMTQINNNNIDYDKLNLLTDFDIINGDTISLINKKFLELVKDNQYKEYINYQYIIPNLILTNRINDKNLNYLYDLLVQDLLGNKEPIKIIAPFLIDAGVIDKNKLSDLLDKLLDLMISNNEINYDFVVIGLINTLDLTTIQQNKLNSFILSLLKSSSYGNNRIISGYIKTGKVSIFNQKDEKNSLYIENKYKENYELFNLILSKIDTNELNLIIYLKNNFLNLNTLKNINIFLDYDIAINLFSENLEFIFSDDSLNKAMLRYYGLALKSGLYDRGLTHKEINLHHYEFTKKRKISRFPIEKDNLTDYMDEETPLFEFEKDKDFDFPGTKPWTKKWFLEDKKRIRYLKSEKIKTFEKFGTYLATGIIEGSQGLDNIKFFYEHIFKNISYKDNRTNILQLGEVFNLILKQGNYEIFDEVLNNGFGKELKDFIDTYHIKDKGRTIVTLMITKEIRDSFQIFNDSKGQEQVDYLKMEEVFKIVQEKLEKYRKKIDLYKAPPIKTSIGLEYEVTESIAKGYLESIGSDYKNDIEIISEYAEVAEGNDAVHEIATNPTDNPYLLILEMKLLDDLDFLDLNFKKEDYARGSRGVHITTGGEIGIDLDNHTRFIQNILLAGNLGGLNAGEDISNLGLHSSIRQRDYDNEILFGTQESNSVEFRSLGIDKKEQFERLVISLFNLSMISQLARKYFQDNFSALLKVDNLSYKKFREIFLAKHKEEIKTDDEKTEIIIKNIYEYISLHNDIESIIENHNKNFEENETTTLDNEKGLNNLINLMLSTNPVIELMRDLDLSIYFYRALYESELNGNPINSIEHFEEILKTQGRNSEKLTQRQKQIIYNGYRLRIRKNLEILKDENIEIYENIEKYLNGNIEDTIRKITNKKRFDEVIKSSGKTYEMYMNSITINLDYFKGITMPYLVNQFTAINNLFIKKDSTNALSMYDTTKEQTGEIISDRRLSETTSFDKLELGLQERDGVYVIQGASDSMLTQAIQKRIQEFNKNLQI